MLTITVSCAAVLNGKIIKSADEITQKIDAEESEKISELWEESRLIFSLLLPQEKTEKINIIIEEIESKNAPSADLRELKNLMEGINDSFKLNLQNIL